jgi:molybdate transport system regulatory protein
MSRQLSFQEKAWTIGLRVWVEHDGQPVLGPGRCQLLEGIDREHSISAAARRIGMSYRHAWGMVQRINQAAGTPLVFTAGPGGVNGGGASLTPEGRAAVAAFRQLEERLRLAASMFEDAA